MDLKEMVVTIVYQSPDGLTPVEIVEALSRQFGTQVTTKQVLQTVQANPKLFVETEGRVKGPSDFSATRADHRMDLKEMMVTIVYQSTEGLIPLQIVDALARQFGTQITTKQVVQTVQANPKLFVEAAGKVRRPSDTSPQRADHRMDLKEMMVTVVYQSPEGLIPLQIVEALAREFGTQMTTKQVLQAVQANPKLFVEAEGRVRRPSDTSPQRADHRMDLKEMMVTVVYQSPGGLIPLQIVDALAREFGTQVTTRQVLQTVEANPKLFVEMNGRVTRPPDHS